MDELEKDIQIRCGDRSLNDLRNNLSFTFHSLTLGQIDIDCKYACESLISQDGHAKYLDRNESAILALSHSFFSNTLSLSSAGRQLGTLCGKLFRHDALVDRSALKFAQRELENRLKLLVCGKQAIVMIHHDNTHGSILEELLEAGPLEQDFGLRPLALGDVAHQRNDVSFICYFRG